MKKERKRFVAVFAAAVLAIGTLTVQAEEGTLPAEFASEVPSLPTTVDLDLSGFAALDVESDTESVEIDAEEELMADTDGEVLDVSDRLRQRSTNILDDDPRATVSGELTADDNMDMYFFDVTSSKFLVAQLASSNSNYYARIYFINYETGQATPSNVGGAAGELIGVNGIPAGSYAFVITSQDGTLGDSYNFILNAKNPSGSIANTRKIYGDFKMLIEYTNGDVYADGVYVYNTSKMQDASANEHMNWEKNDDVNFSGGYIHRGHKVYHITIKEMAGLVSYSSQYATTNNAMLVYCDVETCFSFMESSYVSGQSHEMTFIDTFGKKTPRALTEDDFLDSEHILVFDMNTGKSVDFYSPLNLYYAIGAAGTPKVEAY